MRCANLGGHIIFGANRRKHKLHRVNSFSAICVSNTPYTNVSFRRNLVAMLYCARIILPVSEPLWET